tara:strand:+ start:3751 stop:4161 length:411 start_codon:yes stop_codon:yes gene_type:complete
MDYEIREKEKSQYQQIDPTLIVELNKIYFERGFKYKELIEIGRRASREEVRDATQFREKDWFMDLRFKLNDSVVRMLFPWFIGKKRSKLIVAACNEELISSKPLKDLLKRITKEALNFNRSEFFAQKYANPGNPII